MRELEQLAGAASAAMRSAGVKTATRETSSGVEYRMLIPSRPRPLLIVARVALPGEGVGYADQIGYVDEIGRGKLRKKIKSTAKKVAKSKVLRKLSKMVTAVATVVPGGQGLAAGMAAVKLGKKLAKASKHASPEKKKRIAKLAKAMTKAVHKQRGRVLKPAPGYPNPMASRQPMAVPGNGFGDTPQEDMDSAMDPESVPPLEAEYDSTQDVSEPQEVDASSEDTSDDDTYASDSYDSDEPE